MLIYWYQTLHFDADGNKYIGKFTWKTKSSRSNCAYLLWEWMKNSCQSDIVRIKYLINIQRKMILPKCNRYNETGILAIADDASTMYNFGTILQMSSAALYNNVCMSVSVKDWIKPTASDWSSFDSAIRLENVPIARIVQMNCIESKDFIAKKIVGMKNVQDVHHSRTVIRQHRNEANTCTSSWSIPAIK